MEYENIKCTFNLEPNWYDDICVENVVGGGGHF